MSDHRRPAGVDPTMLEPDRQDDAARIARRAAFKIRHAIVEAISHAGVFDAQLETRFGGVDLAAIVEAEIRSAGGTPEPGIVDVRLGYAEALVATTAIVEALGDPGRSAAESRILADLRQIFFVALGIGVTGRMEEPNARTA